MQSGNLISLVPGNTQLYSALSGKDWYFSFIPLQKPQAQQWEHPDFSREYAVAFTSIMGVSFLRSCCSSTMTWDKDSVEFSQVSFEWLCRVCRCEGLSKLCADPSSLSSSFSLITAGYEKHQAYMPLCGAIPCHCVFFCQPHQPSSLISAILTLCCCPCRSAAFGHFHEESTCWLVFQKRTVRIWKSKPRDGKKPATRRVQSVRFGWKHNAYKGKGRKQGPQWETPLPEALGKPQNQLPGN